MELSILFGIPRKELQRRMDAEEFAELLAYHRFIEPIGYVRSDIQTAQICSLIGAAAGAKNSITDYLLKYNSRNMADKSREQREFEIQNAMALHRAQRKLGRKK